MQCNICGSTKFKDFYVKGNVNKIIRKNVQCVECLSLERTRLLWLYIEKTINITKDTKILHFAPEKSIYNQLSKIVPPSNYTTADINPQNYPFTQKCKKIDLTKLDDMPSFTYDIVLHSHVLEHVPCNIAYTLYHLHRILKKDGFHICIIPFMSGKWDECFAEIDKSERQQRFGQYDHLRRFGQNDISKHLGSILNVPDKFDATIEFDPMVLSDANIPKSQWTGFHRDTVLLLRREDMKLLSFRS